jgi:two-component sensor histidine kinase
VKREAAQDLGIVLHELATNAAKYGALRTLQGRITIQWEHNPDTGRFHMSWREIGNPEVQAPEHRGFGHMMITDMIAHYGEANLEFDTNGVLWELTAPAISLFAVQ